MELLYIHQKNFLSFLSKNAKKTFRPEYFIWKIRRNRVMICLQSIQILFIESFDVFQLFQIPMCFLIFLFFIRIYQLRAAEIRFSEKITSRFTRFHDTTPNN